MATSAKGVDRRAQRTRQMIRQAFIELASEKGLIAATVQEITERANISRGTFYAHYADKYDLVDAIVREEFQRNIGTGFSAKKWNRQTLYWLIQTLLGFFKDLYQRHNRSREIAPFLEKAIQEELNSLVLSLLKENNKQTSGTYISLETMAQIISWTIYGAALQWSQTTTTITAEQMADDVVRIIMDGLEKTLWVPPSA